MKKLVFMLAAAAMVATTKAASVNWTCTYVYGGNTSDTISGVAYFLTTGMLSYNDAQALAGKGADAIMAALGSAYSFNGSAGTFTVKAANAVPNTTLGLSDGTSYDAYLMIFDTAAITDSSKYYLTGTKSLLTYSGADDSVKVSWGSQYDNTTTAGAWSSVKASDPEPPIDSPEPTSGLLMLIGAAGLALRRKRA